MHSSIPPDLERIGMLETYSMEVLDTNAPLRPTLEEALSRFTLTDRIVKRVRCWIPQPMLDRNGGLYWNRHIFGSGIRYKGTALKGTGYLVCSRCGAKKKFAHVRP